MSAAEPSSVTVDLRPTQSLLPVSQTMSYMIGKRLGRGQSFIGLLLRSTLIRRSVPSIIAESLAREFESELSSSSEQSVAKAAGAEAIATLSTLLSSQPSDVLTSSKPAVMTSSSKLAVWGINFVFEVRREDKFWRDLERDSSASHVEPCDERQEVPPYGNDVLAVYLERTGVLSKSDPRAVDRLVGMFNTYYSLLAFLGSCRARADPTAPEVPIESSLQRLADSVISESYTDASPSESAAPRVFDHPYDEYESKQCRLPFGVIPRMVLGPEEAGASYAMQHYLLTTYDESKVSRMQLCNQLTRRCLEKFIETTAATGAWLDQRGRRFHWPTNMSPRALRDALMSIYIPAEPEPEPDPASASGAASSASAPSGEIARTQRSTVLFHTRINNFMQRLLNLRTADEVEKATDMASSFARIYLLRDAEANSLGYAEKQVCQTLLYFASTLVLDAFQTYDQLVELMNEVNARGETLEIRHMVRVLAARAPRVFQSMMLWSVAVLPLVILENGKKFGVTPASSDLLMLPDLVSALITFVVVNEFYVCRHMAMFSSDEQSAVDCGLHHARMYVSNLFHCAANKNTTLFSFGVYNSSDSMSDDVLDDLPCLLVMGSLTHSDAVLDAPGSDRRFFYAPPAPVVIESSTGKKMTTGRHFKSCKCDSCISHRFTSDIKSEFTRLCNKRADVEKRLADINAEIGTVVGNPCGQQFVRSLSHGLCMRMDNAARTYDPVYIRQVYQELVAEYEPRLAEARRFLDESRRQANREKQRLERERKEREEEDRRRAIQEALAVEIERRRLRFRRVSTKYLIKYIKDNHLAADAIPHEAFLEEVDVITTSLMSMSNGTMTEEDARVQAQVDALRKFV